MDGNAVKQETDVGRPPVEALPCCCQGVAVLFNDASAADDSRDIQHRSVIYDNEEVGIRSRDASPRASDPPTASARTSGSVTSSVSASLMASVWIAGKRARSTIFAVAPTRQ